MRPRGDLRAALMDAAERLHGELGHFTLRQLCADVRMDEPQGDAFAGPGVRVGISVNAARYTIKNMVRADDLQRVGRVKDAQSNRWVALYEPRQQGLAEDMPTLTVAMPRWLMPVPA